MSNAVTFVSLFLLLLLSAFFSSTELALASASRVRLKMAAEEKNKKAIVAQKLLDDYTKTLSTDLFVNNLVNIALTAIATSYVLDTFGAKYEVISTIVVTVVILLIGEILPKVLATEYADTAVLLIARPFQVVKTICSPLVSAVTFLVEKMEPWWTPKQPEPTATVEELSELLETIEDEGVFTETESELIKSAIEFTDADAHDIMTPRVDMMAFDIEDGLSELLSNDDILSYSRIPVYRENIDSIIGVLPTKSLMRAIIENEQKSNDVIDLESLLMPVVYAHMTRTISSILTEFRKKHLQVAIVVDEFGGTMGMLTLEDVFEEIVGDIFDETDDIEEEVIEQPDGSYEVDGSTNILDFFGEIGYDPKDFESDYTTVGGWATEVLDRFPEPGDHFEYGRLDVTVTEAQTMRVEKLKIILNPDPEEEDEE